MKFVIFAAFMAALQASAGQARTVELLSFVQSPPHEVSSSASGDAVTPEPILAGALADFVDSDVSAVEPAPAEVPPLTVGLQIPDWMKRGKASRFFRSLASASSAFPTAAHGCTREPYTPNPRLPFSIERRRVRYYGLVATAACEAGVPTHLLDALVTQESGYHPGARSPVGAMGLAQLMPGTARELGVGNPMDPLENLRGGARYLRAQLDEFKRYDLALGAYNAGPARVRRVGRVPYIRETIGYVNNILEDVRWSLRHRPFVAAADGVFARSTPVRKASLAQF